MDVRREIVSRISASCVNVSMVTILLIINAIGYHFVRLSESVSIISFRILRFSFVSYNINIH